MPTKEDATIELINIAIGKISALFMSKETKGTKIVMPSEELIRIGNKLAFVKQQGDE
jgi:hypothetical protein